MEDMKKPGRPPTNKEDHVFVRARVPREIHKSFKLACTEDDLVMEDVMRDLIKDWLVKRDKKKSA
jgi:ParG